MEVRIINKFHDRADYTKVYLVGETITVDDIRANSLIKRGLAEPVAEDAIEVAEVESEEPVAEEVEAETEPEAESVAEEVNEVAETSEEAIVKPVATKRRSSKDNGIRPWRRYFRRIFA